MASISKSYRLVFYLLKDRLHRVRRDEVVRGLGGELEQADNLALVRRKKSKQELVTTNQQCAYLAIYG